MHKGKRILSQDIIAELCPLSEIHILILSHCSTVCVILTPPTVFDAGILKNATQFRHAFGICKKETEF